MFVGRFSFDYSVVLVGGVCVKASVDIFVCLLVKHTHSFAVSFFVGFCHVRRSDGRGRGVFVSDTHR